MHRNSDGPARFQRKYLGRAEVCRIQLHTVPWVCFEEFDYDMGHVLVAAGIELRARSQVMRM